MYLELEFVFCPLYHMEYMYNKNFLTLACLHTTLYNYTLVFKHFNYKMKAYTSARIIINLYVNLALHLSDGCTYRCI